MTQRDVPSTTQQDHCEKQQGAETSAPSNDGMDLHAQQRPNEATTNFTDFMYVSITFVYIKVFIYNKLLHFTLLHFREYIFYILLCGISSLIDAEEDDAIEEAIRRSLSEEPVQSFQDSRYICIN